MESTFHSWVTFFARGRFDFSFSFTWRRLEKFRRNSINLTCHHPSAFDIKAFFFKKKYTSALLWHTWTNVERLCFLKSYLSINTTLLACVGFMLHNYIECTVFWKSLSHLSSTNGYKNRRTRHRSNTLISSDMMQSARLRRNQWDRISLSRLFS